MQHNEAGDVPGVSRVDRRRDLRGWVLTPLLTLLLAPAATAILGFLVAIEADSPPTLCETAARYNRCEEVSLATAGQHVVIFAVLWSLLWLAPWWRGLRTVRIVLAVLAAAALVIMPFRFLP